MARVAWQFTTINPAGTISLEINPNESDSPQLSKNITQQSSTAAGGNAILMEGRDTVKRMSFSGVTLTEQQYDDWVTIFSQRNPIAVVDDLGRTFTMYITSFAPKRVRSSIYPWRHTYTVECLVV